MTTTTKITIPRHEIEIEDVDDDGVFDVGSDRISVDDGQEISGIQNELRSLGIDSISISGFRINPFKGYIESMQRAEDSARGGSAAEMERTLESARQFAAAGNITFNESRMEEITAEGYRTGYYVGMRRAESFVECGNLDAVEGELREAGRCAEKAGESFYDTWAATIRAKCDAKRSHAAMEHAEQHVNSGSVDEMEQALADARLYADRAGITFDEEREKNIYRTAYLVRMRRAESFLEDGNLDAIEGLVAEAGRCAEKAGESSYGAWAATIRARCNAERSDAAMERAEQCAHSGSMNGIERALADARRYADRAGITFDDERAKEIYKDAYVMAISYASIFAALGHVDDMEHQLASARLSAERAGISFDEEKAAWIRGIVA